MLLRYLPLAGLLLFAPVPALAHTQDELDCVVRETPADLRKFLVDTMMELEPAEGPEYDAQTDRVYDMTARCVGQLGIAEDKVELFYRYAEARLAQVELTDRLAAMGVPSAAIDEALKLGPDGTNPDIDQVSESDIFLIEFSLRAKNVDVDALPDAAWEDMGTYISSAAAAYKTLAQLR